MTLALVLLTLFVIGIDVLVWWAVILGIRRAWRWNKARRSVGRRWIAAYGHDEGNEIAKNGHWTITIDGTNWWLERAPLRDAIENALHGLGVPFDQAAGIVSIKHEDSEAS